VKRSAIPIWIFAVSIFAATGVGTQESEPPSNVEQGTPPAAPRPKSPATKTPQTGQMRLKLGDSFEGFRMSEIQDRRVVFTKGGSKVEVSLDFFRKFEDARDAKEKVKTATPVPPRIAPRIPVPRRAVGEGPAKAQE
jgi:hypothetical protein